MKSVTALGTTYYVWEGSQVIAEYSNGQQSGTGGVKYYHQDRLSTRMITNESGAVVGTQDHLPYGEDIGTSGVPEKHRFTTYERDAESGTDYAMNRQYGYVSGRFNRPDPIAGNGGNPQSWNRYTYSLNDPVNLVDPTGLLQCMIDWVVAPCTTALGLLQGGAGVIYNGSPTVNIGGQLSTFRVDSQGNFITNLRVATYHVVATTERDENGFPVFAWGVTERTVQVSIPIPNLPVGLAYRLGYIPPGVETDWGTQLLIGGGLGTAITRLAAVGGGGAAATEVAASQPNRIYSARELLRRVEDPGPMHNFPGSFDDVIFQNGDRVVVSPSYIEYRLPGSVNGRTGIYEIGVRPSASGNTEVIIHRFFQPDRGR